MKDIPHDESAANRRSPPAVATTGCLVQYAVRLTCSPEVPNRIIVYRDRLWVPQITAGWIDGAYPKHVRYMSPTIAHTER
jgi:hypothetical protein